MEMVLPRRFRFQYSLRALFAGTAIVALLLVPVAWVARERRQMLEAREAAVRAVVLAERNRVPKPTPWPKPTPAPDPAQNDDVLRAPADSAASETDGAIRQVLSRNMSRELERVPNPWPGAVEQLRRENAELKKKVERLEREIERLRALRQH